MNVGTEGTLTSFFFRRSGVKVAGYVPSANRRQTPFAFWIRHKRAVSTITDSNPTLGDNCIAQFALIF